MRTGDAAARLAAEIQRKYDDRKEESSLVELSLAKVARAPLTEAAPPEPAAAPTSALSSPEPAPAEKPLDPALADAVTERVYRLMCREVRQGIQRGERID